MASEAQTDLVSLMGWGIIVFAVALQVLRTAVRPARPAVRCAPLAGIGLLLALAAAALSGCHRSVRWKCCLTFRTCPCWSSCTGTGSRSRPGSSPHAGPCARQGSGLALVLVAAAVVELLVVVNRMSNEPIVARVARSRRLAEQAAGAEALGRLPANAVIYGTDTRSPYTFARAEFFLQYADLRVMVQPAVDPTKPGLSLAAVLRRAAGRDAVRRAGRGRCRGGGPGATQVGELRSTNAGVSLYVSAPQAEVRRAAVTVVRSSGLAERIELAAGRTRPIDGGTLVDLPATAGSIDATQVRYHPPAD